MSEEWLVHLAADIDDMEGEGLAAAADSIRARGALDVVLVPLLMKKGRPGTRIEVLCTRAAADMLTLTVLESTTTLGVRRADVRRTALERQMRSVRVLEHDMKVKVARLPDGTVRAKAEDEDVRHVANVTGRTAREVRALATREAERLVFDRVQE